MRFLLLCLVCLTACADANVTASAQSGAGTTATTAAAASRAPSTQAFARVLQAYLRRGGRFDYAGLSADSARRADLDAYLAAVGHACVDGWSRDEQLAFYLNAYDALVIHAVLRRWPIQSVMHEDGFFGRDSYTVAGQTMTLDQLENQIIRGPRFAEPRIHFAVNCASVGCPRLWPTPFSAQNLEAELERCARAFVRQSTSVNRETRHVRLSKLFSWFARDFGSAGGVGAFVARYLDPEDAAVARDPSATLDFDDYDWAINAPSASQGAHR